MIITSICMLSLNVFVFKYSETFLCFCVCTQAHLPEIKVHAYFAPVTPPPSVHGGGQRLCRCCIILWQWRARGGHLCLQVLLLWWGGWRLFGDGGGRVGGVGERRGWTHSLLLINTQTDPRWSLISGHRPSSLLQLTGQCGSCLGGVGGKRCEWLDFLSFSLSVSLFLPVRTRTGRSLCNAPHVPEWPQWMERTSSDRRAGLSEHSKHSSLFFRVQPKSVMMLSCWKTAHNPWRVISTTSVSTWPSCETLLLWPRGSMEGEQSWTALEIDINSLEPDETSVEMLDFCSIFISVCTEMFLQWKKMTLTAARTETTGEANKIILFFPPTACCKCPYLTSHRWARACLSFCHVKEKQRLSTDSDPPCQKAVDTRCCGDEMASFVNCGCVSV